MKRFSVKGICSVLVLTALLAMPAFAQHGGSDHHGGHTPSISDLTLYYINFAIYLVIMFFLLRKTFSNGWQARRERLLTMVQGSKQELEQAQTQHAAIQKQLSNVETEIRDIQETIRAETSREIDHIRAEGKKRAERIISQAKEAVQIEQKTAEQELKRELADLATEKAREKIKRELTPDADKIYRERALSSVKELIH